MVAVKNSECDFPATNSVHPLFVFNQFGDLERCADDVLKPVVARYQGKVSRIYFRADAAFAMPEVYEFLEAERIKYAIRLPANQVLQSRIGYIAISTPVTVTSDRGEEHIIALVGAGEIIGELSLIDHKPRSASAIALCDSTFRYITRQAFEDCTKDDPEIYKDLAAILAARLRETDEALAAASFLSVRGCVARTLLELVDYIGKDAGRGRILLDQRISGKDLAAMAGVARENVSRVLSDLKKRGVIEQRLQSYVLKDIGALEREVHHLCLFRRPAEKRDQRYQRSVCQI